MCVPDPCFNLKCGPKKYADTDICDCVCIQKPCPGLELQDSESCECTSQCPDLTCEKGFVPDRSTCICNPENEPEVEPFK